MVNPDNSSYFGAAPMNPALAEKQIDKLNKGALLLRSARARCEKGRGQERPWRAESGRRSGFGVQPGEARMSQSEPVALKNVQQTLLLPLWGRAVETRKEHPLLVDRKADEIVAALDYDFAAMAESLTQFRDCLGSYAACASMRRRDLFSQRIPTRRWSISAAVSTRLSSASTTAG